MFTNILNPFIRSRNMKKNKDGIWVDDQVEREYQYIVDRGNTDLGSNGVVMFNTEKKVIIDSFQLSTNVRDFIRPRLHATREFNYTEGTGQFAPNIFMATGITDSGSATRFDATNNYVHRYGHPFLESTVFASGRYKMINKVPIVLSNGGKLTIFGTNGYNQNTHNWSCIVVYREIEVN